MIVYEMCVLFFKMAVDLRMWDDNCVDELCNLVFSHYLLRTMVRYSANDQVWEHITSTLNACIGKAFTKREMIRKFKSIGQRCCTAMGAPRYGHWGYVPPVASPDQLFDDPSQ